MKNSTFNNIIGEYMCNIIIVKTTASRIPLSDYYNL